MSERLENGISVKFSDCATCTFLTEGRRCPAYPVEIPEDIWGAGIEHRAVRVDQVGDTTYRERVVAS